MKEFTFNLAENGHSVSKTVEIEVKNASTNGNNMETTTAGCAPDVKVMETTEDQEEMLDDPLADVASGEDSSTASTLTNQHSKTLALQRVQAPVTGDDREKEASSRSLWIRGLTSATKAADLKVQQQHGQGSSSSFISSTLVIMLYVYSHVADKSKVPAVKVAAAPVVRKEAKVEETKSDTEKEKRDENKEESVESAPSVRRESVEKKREEKPREDRKSAGGSSRRRDSGTHSAVGSIRSRERGPSKTFHSSEKREDRRPFRDPRRDAQRMIASAPRRFPVPGSRNIVHRNSISHRLTRPGDRSTLPPSAMLRRPEAWDRRDMMDLIRRKEEEHRRREQELERERALERERERIRFEREQLEKERLQLQLQAALQQQKLASLSSRNKDTFAVPSQHSSRGVSSRVERSSRGEHRSTSHSSGSNSTSTLKLQRTTIDEFYKNAPGYL
uniref:SAFB-like transcription modulator n=1 Tax=Heterorhabditis bacteriophora TaxID=37862 RepID=A0A1I7XNT4_HETBA